MKIGVLLNNFGGFPETGRGALACIDLARHAERLGFDSVWVTDHVVLPLDRKTPYPHNASGLFPYTWEQDIFEPITLMAALATATERVEIGVSVLVIPYRHPLLTAKMLATADQLSQGRIILGAGVGWLRDEFEALGLPEEVYEHRGTVTVDYLRAMQSAWTAPGGASHKGPFVEFSDIGTRPLPFRRPHPPTWIGGQGERALKRTVDLGQGYLAISSNPADMARDTSRLRALCEEAEREPGSLEVGHIDGLILADDSVEADGASLVGSNTKILDELSAYADSGLTHLIAGISRFGDMSFDGALGALEEVAAEILPKARAL
jgi:probable F420-dependent oxidoreductase